MKPKLKRLATVLAFLIIAGLWLKEFTQRRARESADIFMGPFLTELTVRDVTFIPYYRGLDKTLNGPRWLVYYDSYQCPSDLSYPCLAVDLFGHVRSCFNLRGFDALMNLSEEERFTKQVLMLDELKRARSKEKTQSAEPAGGAYVSPAAGDPSAHP